MKPDPTRNENLPDEPNEDGCVLGTAGRDEDPNATTDWDHPEPASANRKTGIDPSTRPPNGTPQIDVVPADNGNDGAD